MTIESYVEAKTKFLSGDFISPELFFAQNHYVVEYGYCKLLSGYVDEAKHIFSSASKYDFRADWAEKLTQFINGQVYNMPSYFQIRDFLEIDLNMLIRAQKPEFVENIINGADLFYSVNQESYKFIARVMLFNDFNDVALHYLLKAKDKFYYDPEMHLMLANCYMKSGNSFLARQSLTNCLGILPNYLPAKKLLAELV